MTSNYRPERGPNLHPGTLAYMRRPSTGKKGVRPCTLHLPRIDGLMQILGRHYLLGLVIIDFRVPWVHVLVPEPGSPAPLSHFLSPDPLRTHLHARPPPPARCPGASFKTCRNSLPSGHRRDWPQYAFRHRIQSHRCLLPRQLLRHPARIDTWCWPGLCP